MNIQFTSVQSLSHIRLCNPMGCCMPGFPVHNQPWDFTQTHVHRVGDAVQSSHLLSSPSPAFPATRSFPVSQFFTSVGQSIGASASASVLPMTIQGWFPLGLTGLISLLSKGLSQKSSPAPQFENINSSAISLLYGPTFTSLHDYWKNHSIDLTDLCCQSDVSAF